MSNSASPPKDKPTPLLDRRLIRRLGLIPAAAIISIIVVVLSPLLVLIAALNDLVTRQPRWRRTRLAALLIGALAVELVGMMLSLLAWIITGFGFVGSTKWRWHMYRGFIGFYTGTLLQLIAKVLGTHIEWHDNADLSTGPVVLIARHTSFFDALIPATLLAQRNQLLAHHVLTHGLRYAPCIDLVGHRLPNRFIRRTPAAGSSELAGIEALGRVLDERSAAIIFPEGTFRSPERFKRVLQSLKERDPALAARAAGLRHVLPPRSSGTFALLEGAPSADLVICTNTGFEPFGTIRHILDHPWTDKPIIIETKRIARDQIPNNATEFTHWLFNQYVEIDNWVEKTGVSPLHSGRRSSDTA